MSSSPICNGSWLFQHLWRLARSRLSWFSSCWGWRLFHIAETLSRPQVHTLNIVLAWETEYFSGKGRIEPLGMWYMLTEVWNQSRLTEFSQLLCLLLQVIDAKVQLFGFLDFSGKVLGIIGLGFLHYTKKCIKIKIKVER